MPLSGSIVSFVKEIKNYFLYVLVFVTDLLWYYSEMFSPWEKNDENKNWKSIYFVFKEASIGGLKYFVLQWKAKMKITWDLEANPIYTSFWILKRQGIIIFLHSLGFKVTAGFQTDVIGVTDTVYLKFLNRKSCIVFITGQKKDCQEHFL